ncbi:MAG: hypothetical protein IMX05_01465 [Hydrogenibacillus schlegelii]|nr:hypothetical protein [Hydrogenibacillus schlegelii]
MLTPKDIVDKVVPALADIFAGAGVAYSDEQLSERAPAAGIATVEAEFERSLASFVDVTLTVVIVGEYGEILDAYHRVATELPRRVAHHLIEVRRLTVDRGLETGELDVGRFEIYIGG